MKNYIYPEQNAFSNKLPKTFSNVLEKHALRKSKVITKTQDSFMKKVIEDTFIGKSNNKQIQIKKQTLELIPRKTFLKNEKMKNEYNS